MEKEIEYIRFCAKRFGWTGWRSQWLSYSASYEVGVEMTTGRCPSQDECLRIGAEALLLERIRVEA